MLHFRVCKFFALSLFIFFSADVLIHAQEEECYVSADGETICVQREQEPHHEEQSHHTEEQRIDDERNTMDEKYQEIHQEQDVVEEPTENDQTTKSSDETVVENDGRAKGTNQQPVQEESGRMQEEETRRDTPVETSTEEETNGPNCPSRSHVIRCAAKYLDKNHNNYLERSELETAIDQLPWLSRGILKILGSLDKMMAKCDIDGDGAIGIDYDMSHNGETCLATCFKRRAFKAAFFPNCDSGASI